jgi:hypothetical protein
VRKHRAGQDAVEGPIFEWKDDLLWQHAPVGVVELVVNVLKHETAPVNPAHEFCVTKLDAFTDGVEAYITAQFLVQEADHLAAISTSKVQNMGTGEGDAPLQKFCTL